MTDDLGTTTYTCEDRGNLMQSATPEGTLHYGFNAVGQHIRTWATPMPTSSQIYTDLSYSRHPQSRLSTVTAIILTEDKTGMTLFSQTCCSNAMA